MSRCRVKRLALSLGAAVVGCGPDVAAVAEATGGEETMATSTSSSSGSDSVGSASTTNPETTEAATGESTGGLGTGTDGTGRIEPPEPACPDGTALPLAQHLSTTGAFQDTQRDGAYQPAGSRDVNGDGRDDFVVLEEGRIFVVLGGFDTTATDVNDLAAAGGAWTIVGVPGESIHDATVVGDVTGDGLADVVIMAKDEQECECAEFCTANAIPRGYVVAGSPAPLLVDLQDVADGLTGTLLAFESTDSCSSVLKVRAAGDLDGDGQAEVIVSPSYHHSLVVAGADLISATTLSLPTDAWWVSGLRSLHAAGDVNGDEVADLIGRDDNNNIVVLRGTPDDVPTTAFLISGANGANSPAALGVGDINDDGLDDLAIEDVTLEQFLIVFGKSTSETVATDDVAAGIGGFGVVVPGPAVSRRRIAAAGDVDGDGLTDLVVTDRDLSSPEVPRAYVIYGKSDTAQLDLCDVAAGNGGFGFAGSPDQPTLDAVGVGDLDGDGRQEVRVETIDGVFVVRPPR